jgi:hypothetical protein
MTLIVIISLVMIALSGCETLAPTPDGNQVGKVEVNVAVGSDGLTAGQRNAVDKLAEDNKVGAIKFLYIINAISGDVLFYSTVAGKVTSGGMRLEPNTIVGTGGYGDHNLYGFTYKGGTYYTEELIQDDGTYGTSAPFIYWFDTNHIYHQVYVNTSSLILVNSQPLAIKSSAINLDGIISK